MLKKSVLLCVASVFTTFSWAEIPHLKVKIPEIFEIKKESVHGEVPTILAQETKALLAMKALKTSDLEPYLTFDLLVSPDALVHTPQVIGSQEGRRYISTQSAFYIDAVVADENWFVYRPHSVFERKIGEQNHKMLSLIKIAQARLKKPLKNMSEMALTKQYQEVRVGDLLLPHLSSKTGAVLPPSLLSFDIEGQLIGHLYDSSYIGLRQIAVVSLGQFDGIKKGDLLFVTQDGAVIDNVLVNEDLIDKDAIKEIAREKAMLKQAATANVEIEKGVIGKRASGKREEGVLGETAAKAYFPAKSVATLLVIQDYSYFSLAMVAKAQMPLAAPMPVIGAQK